MNQKLLTLRKKISAKRPHFLRQDAMKVSRSRIPHKWRKPQGIHSKHRHGFAGHTPCASVGYRGPAEVRGLHKTGLEQILVSSLSELAKINKASQGAILSRHVGMKKRAEIIKIATKEGIKILNIKDSAACLKKIEDTMLARKQAKTQAAKHKEEKTKEKTAETKKETLADKTKEEEKKELDRLLTKREA